MAEILLFRAFTLSGARVRVPLWTPPIPHFNPLGLPRRFRWYDCRHTCATLLLAAGENPKVVSERLGHTKVAFTLDRYGHVMPGMQEKAAAKLETILFAR